MSILVLDHQVFSYICSGLKKAAYETEVTTMYSSKIRHYFAGKDINQEATELVKQWFVMNETSYNIRYKETGTTEDVLQLRYYPVKPHQLLKYLMCLEYNIELGETKPLKLLRQWINDLMYGIVSDSELYKSAKWSDL
jgi:hypothetical protein